MKAKIILLIICSLALLFFLSSCTREAIEEPSPLGPSTYATVLALSASPNVLFAGDIRESTTITAKLQKFDGVPLSNKTIYFEIGDELGNKVDVGYLEGYGSAITKITNSSGIAAVSYTGPYAQELASNATIYIWATVSGEGKNFIVEMAPLQIIKYSTELYFEVVATPNVIFATTTRPESTVAALVQIGTTPVEGRKVFFEILSGPGHFSDRKRTTYVLTDAEGIAAITYIGPTKNEIAWDTMVLIRAQLETATPTDFIYKEVDIRVIRQQ